jgi:magnesium-protoporphyrin O-methyltransferase
MTDASLIDIGGGVGAILHEMLGRGARSGTQIDASTAYLEASHEEALRRGHADRLTFIAGDAVERTAGMPSADVVTLDKVLCCYPDMRALIHATAPLATRFYGLVYPRKAWWTRVGSPLANLYLRMTRRWFRTYLHDPAAIDQAVRREGFVRHVIRRHVIWEVAVYARAA